MTDWLYWDPHDLPLGAQGRATEGLAGVVAQLATDDTGRLVIEGPVVTHLLPLVVHVHLELAEVMGGAVLQADCGGRRGPAVNVTYSLY